MTTFRYEAIGAALLSLLVTGACGEMRDTKSVREIMGSDLKGEELREAFGARIGMLSKNKALLAQEMESAGFRLRPLGGKCGRWEYPVAKVNQMVPTGFVHFCDDGKSSARVLRVGLTRGPMSYD